MGTVRSQISQLLLISQTAVLDAQESSATNIDCNISKQSDWLSSKTCGTIKKVEVFFWIQCQKVVSLRLIPKQSKPEKW